MTKQPHIQLYTGDWLKDPELSVCSPATRGVWIDLICALHELGRGGLVTGTPEQLARLCRCTPADVQGALLDLQTHRAADISDRNGVYTVICRRMKRDANRQAINRVNGSKRAAKYERKPDTDNDSEGERVIVEFVKELGLPESDGTACWHKWQGNGWTNGGKPIKDWRSTVRSWKVAGYLPSQKPAVVARGGFGAKEDKLHFHEKAKAPIPEPPGFQSWLDSTYPDKAGTKLASMVRPLQESLMKEFNVCK